MFSRKRRIAAEPLENEASGTYLLALDGGGATATESQRDLQAVIPENARCALQDADSFRPREAARARFVLCLFASEATLDQVADAVLEARADGATTTLIVAVRPNALVALGRWLSRRAEAERLAGTRLMVATDIADVTRQLPDRLTPVSEDNVIRMPKSTEVEDSAKTTFFTFSPQMHALVARIRAFADNGIERAYLLGGPGSGKTSLAYYYYLARGKGRFVSVNLLAEDTNDKSAIKSLLCGHVPGAFPGAGARVGSFDIARDGVCFLDESHGVMGSVMETLMEALDNGQYMPYGAAAKRPLQCALVFATNRSWDHLLASVNIDEFTRLGAATLQVPELSGREEDMIAITATTLARLSAPCTSWEPPTGLDTAAWQRILECRWHGNVRALIRVLEAAFVETASGGGAGRDLIGADAIEAGIRLWEPAEHHSHAIFASSMDEAAPGA
ncbi:sigma 54-interacting transcriptional regulator [Algiphilus aromaticivorans]|uniref:sigma 54-interacting transcriptional regulator n=1 Tax=Algiphilus aromaticivorans TaxID=382454 RepID=UPI000694F63A|nr:sigma 54-interacting transcriptional regulator [Algiphilus aromaticivorans]